VALTLLILGGTRFVGRALVDAALEDGHHVTLFNRGRTNPSLFPEAEHLRGDRTSDLSALAGRRWDAVVDGAAYHPRDVRRSVDALRTAVDRYLLVSSVSVYADQSVPQHETSEVARLESEADSSGESYGARKAACESAVRDFFGERATIVRPGLIVGRGDSTDRFSYWPKRIERGGTVLAPGSPDDPLQWIDVRDLADFLLRLITDRRGGTFNATGDEVSFGDLLASCMRVTDTEAELAWVPTADLLAAGLDPWMGVPLWIAAPGWEAANRVPNAKALAAGLAFRPIDETVRAAWIDRTPVELSVALSPEREAELLRTTGGPRR
jgi:nucleoside-diphosphate-sugar epimerase